MGSVVAKAGELLDFLNNSINYGIVIDGKYLQDFGVSDFEKYRTLTPEQFLEQRVGVCWDFAMYEADWFSRNLPNTNWVTWFIVLDGDVLPSHSFITFEDNGSIYYLESSYFKHRGLYVADSYDAIISRVWSWMVEGEKELKKLNAVVRSYKANNPSLFGLRDVDFMSKVLGVGRNVLMNDMPLGEYLKYYKKVDGRVHKLNAKEIKSL